MTFLATLEVARAHNEATLPGYKPFIFGNMVIDTCNPHRDDKWVRTLIIDDAMDSAVMNTSTGEPSLRFITDCEKTSGRVYDRFRCEEVPRLVVAWGGLVFDRLTSQMRKRSLMDDLRALHEDEELEVAEEEQEMMIRYELY